MSNFDSGTPNPMYFQSIRKAIAAFGTVFNEIWISRTNSKNGGITNERVVLGYGPKEFWLSKQGLHKTYDSTLYNDVEFSRKYPFMSYAMTAIDLDSNRQRNPMNKVRSSIGGHASTIRSPVPVNISLRLSIYSKNIEDSLMILEQILPMFQPQISLRINEISEFGLTNDATIILNSVVPDDNYMSGNEENRTVVWDLDFTLRSQVYPPYKVRTGIIENVIVEVTPVVEIGGILEYDGCCPCESYTQEDIDRMMNANINRVVEP